MADQGKRWTLAGPLPALAVPTPDNIRDLILRRVSLLPTSARRLLTLASVIGPQFDAELLEQTGGEHKAVIEAAIDIWLERRLVRRVPRRWVASSLGLPPEPVDNHTRWGTLEFAHDVIRVAIYEDVSPQRRQVMHRQVARALEKRYAAETDQLGDALAHHYAIAGVWDKAFTYLQQAGDRARRLQASQTALRYYDQALKALDRLESYTADDPENHGWLEKRLQIIASQAQLYTGQTGLATDPECVKDVVERLRDGDAPLTIVAPLDSERPSA